MERRKFIKTISAASAGAVFAQSVISCKSDAEHVKEESVKPELPVAICTWNFRNAIVKAGEVISSGGSSIDAVEQGVMVEEADETNTTVGRGGAPDRDGNVTLDACIMNKDGDYGAVACLRNILHPVSVARMVMEKTPHAILAGKGALQFALENGFKEENLLTEKSRKEWEKWKVKSEYKPVINIESHDTIGMLALDKNGDIAGACTTSGLAYKMAGRVGDSPIIGSGLYVDNEVGGAVATGLGEEVLKNVCCFLVVELMRNGASPGEASKTAIERIIARNKDYKDFQVGLIALNKNGIAGSYSIHDGFSYAMHQNNEIKNIQSPFYNKEQ